MQPSHAVHPLTPLITYSDEHFAPGPHSAHHPQDAKGIHILSHTLACKINTFDSSQNSSELSSTLSFFGSGLEQLEELGLWGWQGVWQKTAHKLNSICAPSGRRLSLQQLNMREEKDRRNEREIGRMW